MGKPPKKSATRLGSFGERVARERAARRRTAKERAALEKAARVQALPPEESPAGPETIDIPQSDLANELTVLAALIAAGLARSHPEAKRLLRDDGILVNDEPVLSDKAKLTLGDVTADGVIKVSLGSERHVLLRPA